MDIPDGYTNLPKGKIASVVTYLEMTSAPQSFDDRLFHPGWTLRRHHHPDVHWYRDLFRTVGQNWFWFSRLNLDDGQLRSVFLSGAIELFTLEVEGADKGMLEIDRSRFPEIEIAFLGVNPDFVGHGGGLFLMKNALEIAWAQHPTRVVVHTCTLDHHRALGFYLKCGFVPYRRAIEVSDDPRLDGRLPRSAAPHVPIL